MVARESLLKTLCLWAELRVYNIPVFENRAGSSDASSPGSEVDCVEAFCVQDKLRCGRRLIAYFLLNSGEQAGLLLSRAQCFQ